LQAARSPAAASSFLDSGSAWGRSGAKASSSTPQPAPAPTTAAPAARPGFLGGGGSFLGNVAATAAGVAGGAFLFQGLESLLGHRETGFLGTANAAPEVTENVTVNNYDADDKSANLDDADYADDDFSDDSSWT
jgi:hypothetical protein